MPHRRKPIYGQVVVGPPGAGKTTFCNGMQQYLRLLKRNAWVVNMDPANEGTRESPVSDDVAADTAGATGDEDESKMDVDDNTPPPLKLPYETIFNVCEDAVDLTTVMEQMGLGPNGGLLYCMEYLEAHADEIIQTIQQRLVSPTYSSSSSDPQNNPVYLLFDFPGQVELYTHATCVKKLLEKLIQAMDLRLTMVQLIDSHYCAEPRNFIAAALLGTTTMLRLELPSVSVLSKVDLLSRFGELPMQFEYFTECHDLDRLLPFLEGGHVRAHQEDDDFVIDNNDDDNISPCSLFGSLALCQI